MAKDSGYREWYRGALHKPRVLLISIYGGVFLAQQ